jgi:pimeloyl-ACP methyl ester carboxylesterase
MDNAATVEMRIPPRIASSLGESPNFQLRETTVDGARWRYVDIGQGDPLVLLHGWPESHMAWRHQIGPLAASRRVIVPDWIGWGGSTRDATLSYDYDTEVERIGRMLDALGLRRVDLAGHDYGGFLGLGFVQRYPERVRRFAVLNSRAHGTFRAPVYDVFGLLSILARHRLLRSLLTAPPMHYVYYWLHRVLLTPFVRRGAFDADQLESYLAFLKTTEGRRWYARSLGDYRVRVRPELAAGLGAIRCPTAVIWGDRDPGIPFRTAKDLADGIPSATLTRIRGGSHFIMEERAAEVTDALQAWLLRPAD